MDFRTIDELHCNEVELWGEREELQNKIDEIQSKLDDLGMENCVIESDMIQELGYTKEEYDEKLEEVHLQASKLEDEDYRLKENRVEVNKKIKFILDKISERIVEDSPS